MQEGNATISIVADLADAEAYLAYHNHPAHQKVIAERIKPFIVRVCVAPPLGLPCKACEPACPCVSAFLLRLSVPCLSYVAMPPRVLAWDVSHSNLPVCVHMSCTLAHMQILQVARHAVQYAMVPEQNFQKQ